MLKQKKNETQTEEKVKLTPEQKAEQKEKRARRRKTALKVLIIVVAVLAVFILVTSIITWIGNAANNKKAKSFAKVEYKEQLVPAEDGHGNYCFTTDRDFKVLQLTDIHIGGGWMSLKKDAMALNAVAAMVTAEKPDLVIVTGDIAYPVPFQAGTFNNKPPAKMFATLMESLGVYWTLTFGNHDTELYSFYDREDIAKIYEDRDKYPHCLFLSGPEEVDGVGNQIITVRKTDGTVSQLLLLLDSHSYRGGDFLGIAQNYDNIHENQISWYVDNIKLYTAENKAHGETGTVKSTLFFHIPLTEYKDAWYEYVKNDCRDTDNVKLEYGTAGEGKGVIFCSKEDDRLFETVKDWESTQAIFCGHDHYNNFSLTYKGVRLSYGMSIDYLAYPGIYKVGAQRGCTVITFSSDGSFNSKNENYYQDKYTSQYAKEEVSTEPMTIKEDLK